MIHAVVVCAALLASGSAALAASPTPSAVPPVATAPSPAETSGASTSASGQKPAKLLVESVRDANVADLERLSFVELNVLKNAVFAAKGYVFAEDRPWLRALFCEKQEKGRAPGEDATEASSWRLNTYEFPACKDSGGIDDEQAKALANLRVALIKKVGNAADGRSVDKQVIEDLRPLGSGRVLGLRFPQVILGRWGISLERDVAGMRRLWELVQRPTGWDAMDLLGLYAGDVLLLRALIEAKYGKPLGGTLGWEARQILGVLDTRADYDPAKLPIEVQATLQIIDDVIQKIQRSDINDLPASLRGKRLDYSTPYVGVAC